MKKWILVSTILGFVQLQAQAQSFFSGADREGLIQGQITLPALKSFNGSNFGKSDDEIRKALAKMGQAEVNSKTGVATLSNSLGQYKMTWQKQDFENGLDLRINQITYVKEKLGSPAKLRLSTSTFDGDKLRSFTVCDGTKLGSSSDNEVFCATATKKVCSQVLEAYRKNDTLRTPGKTAQESRKIVAENVNSCLKTMNGYADVLRAFSESYEGNAKVKSIREDIVDQENKEVSKLLSGLSGESWKPTSVNSLKGSRYFGENGGDYAKLAEKLTGTMSGLNQINQFVNLCSDHESDFNSTENAKPASGKSESSKK